MLGMGTRGSVRQRGTVMSGIFDGKVALVTGAARGIGAATARMFADNGASVVLGDLLPDVESLASEIDESSNSAVGLAGNVVDPNYCRALVDLAIERFGRLDLVFNNAGIAGNRCDIANLPIDDWKRVIDVNLNGVFYGIKYQVPAMIKNGGGVIVNNSSVLGLKPIPGSSLEYTAAKHAVIGLTRQVAANYGGEGIRCVAICPGFIETPLTAEGSESNSGHDGEDWFLARTPLGRNGKPEDIAGAVKLLCSDDAGFISGEALLVDGGFALS